MEGNKGEGIKILVIDTSHPFHQDTDGNTEIGENFIANEAIEDLTVIKVTALELYVQKIISLEWLV